jgi:hypothetical protein
METNRQFVWRHGRSLVGLAIAVAAAGYGISYETRPRPQQLDYAVIVNELAGNNSGHESWTRPPIDSSEFAAELIAANATGCGSATTERAGSRAGELSNYCAEIKDR